MIVNEWVYSTYFFYVQEVFDLKGDCISWRWSVLVPWTIIWHVGSHGKCYRLGLNWTFSLCFAFAFANFLTLQNLWLYLYINHQWHLSVSKDHRFAPIVQCLLWLWRPIWEWQSLSHLEHVMGVVGLLARHAVFLWSLFSSALIAVFLRIVITPLLLCVSRHLCLWQ